MKEIDFTNHSCNLCGRTCVNQAALGSHLKWTHPGVSTKDYVLKFIFPDGAPLCACGKCGLHVGWHPRKPWFNDYVTGHNPTKGVKRKVKPEDAAKRNISIKAAYKDVDSSARQNVSAGVQAAYDRDPSYHQKIKEHMAKQWSDPEWKATQTATRKRVWSERYDELCAKIFTPEFGQKISSANRQRDLKRTSKAEKTFFDKLAAIGIETIQGIWLLDPVTKRNKCFDGQLVSTGELIEFDGTFWHGLDLNGADPYEVQMVNMENDLHKNALAESTGLGLLRFREDVDLTDVNTEADLRAKAYLIIEPDREP